MTGVLWLVTTAMCVVAFAFLANPLWRSKQTKLAVVLGVAIPSIAASMYLLLGSPNVASGRSMPTTGPSASEQTTAGQGREKVGSISSMVDGLATRLKENPDDGKGWLLLARSYQHLNRTQDAAAAYAKAKALGEIDTTLEASLLVEARPEASTAQINGSVSLSADAAKIVKPTDIVFIFARNVGSSGAPAAVLQRPASELPLDFHLNDTQSMVPGVKLSDFNEVVVTARVSRSGNAMQALQGLEARSDVVDPSAGSHISLVISQETEARTKLEK